MSKRNTTLPRPPALQESISDRQHVDEPQVPELLVPLTPDSCLLTPLPASLREFILPPVRRVALEVPLAPVAGEGYLKRHMEVKLTRCEALLVAQLSAALAAQNARLANGKPVGESKSAAVVWLLQQLLQAALV